MFECDLVLIGFGLSRNSLKGLKIVKVNVSNWFLFGWTLEKEYLVFWLFGSIRDKDDIGFICMVVFFC